jgi:hypothetical protein
MAEVLQAASPNLPAEATEIESIRLVQYADSGGWPGLLPPDRWVWVVTAHLTGDRAAASGERSSSSFRLVIDDTTGSLVVGISEWAPER